MRDVSMEMAKISASIISECLGNTVYNVYYTSDGNDIVMEFANDYPFYDGGSGKVYIKFPRSTFYVKFKNIYFKELQQAECKFYQQSIGVPLAHPHIFNDGHPCWDGGSLTKAPDFISKVIETLTLENVTHASIFIGKPASGVMGVGDIALKNATKHKKAIAKKLKPKDIVNNRFKLQTFVTKRWNSKITMLRRSF